MLEGAGGRPRSLRVVWRPLAPGLLDAFYRLAIDPHVRRYLLDGQIVDRAWCAAEIERSADLFAARGLGLWLLWRGRGLEDTGPGPFDDVAVNAPSGDPVGFAGFRIFDEMGPAPQLIYAFVEGVTGRGLATEVGRALIDVAHAAGLDPITAAVDGPNRASLRVLEKLGFAETRRTTEGDFGETIYLELARDGA